MVQYDTGKDIISAVSFSKAMLQTPRYKSYTKVVNFLLKNYTQDEAIAEIDAATSNITQPKDTMLL